jgi:hypothetical protein
MEVTTKLVDAPAPSPRTWKTDPPAGCPFEKSKFITGVSFTGRHAEYTGADTWYPSWASDGNMYSPYTDGSVDNLLALSFPHEANKFVADTGSAKIIGDDPLNLKVVEPVTFPSDPLPYGGRYPCGSLVHNGVWYYGTYCLMNENGSLDPLAITAIGEVNWAVLGPFVGFRTSTDFGKTWTQTKHTAAKPLFPEPATFGGPVKFGSPHFVDFGKNMSHSPDGKAYLVAHGALVPDRQPRIANASWITGDAVYMARVTPSVSNMEDASKYEFFAGRDDSGKAIWSSDFAKVQPILEWDNHLGCVTVTYNAPLKKYLMCVTDGGTTVSTYDTYILESDHVSGPWKLASSLIKFGPQAYFVNIPSKFISKDGRTVWLCYAANFHCSLTPDPPGSRYGMNFQEIRLLPTAVKIKPNPLDRPDNVARIARATASSCYAGYSADAAIDGVVGGFPGDFSKEWASNGEKNSGSLRLDWDSEQLVDRVWLFDRPNTHADQITSGVLTFSDGSKLTVGALPDDAKKGLEVKFAPKAIRWVRFDITGCKPTSENVGLSEIAVFKAPK